MTKEIKNEYLNKASVACFSGFGGLEIKEILYGIEDTVVFVVGAWCGGREIHTAKIHYETERAYFNYRGVRVHFDEILRM